LRDMRDPADRALWACPPVSAAATRAR
jgi:hypothetical protein